jgi:hypothetical protein
MAGRTLGKDSESVICKWKTLTLLNIVVWMVRTVWMIAILHSFKEEDAVDEEGMI